jgi:hypothetical protein
MVFTQREVEALAKEVHHQAQGPSAWALLTDAGRQYWFNRMWQAVHKANEEIMNENE